MNKVKKNTLVLSFILGLIFVFISNDSYSQCSTYDSYPIGCYGSNGNGIFINSVSYGNFQSTTITADLNFGLGHPSNGTYTTSIPNTTSGQYGNIVFTGFSCPDPLNVTITYTSEPNAPQCTYINGLSCSGCPLPSGNYNTIISNCDDIITGCDNILDLIISENLNEILCNQWEEGCNTTEQIYRVGNVSIGTDNSSLYTLVVTQGIITDAAKVQLCEDGGWCDYVFEPEYDLKPLEEVEKHIAEKGHLHKTPSAAEIESKGSFELKTVTLDHQEKIEEAFLHLIALKKEADDLQVKLKKLKAENVKLKRG
jgi:hypothetical protein